MADNTISGTHEHIEDPVLTKRLSGLLDIVIAFLPLATLGVIGTIIGTDGFLGGALVNLAYVVTIAVATFILRRRGTGWTEIGLGRPESWRRTVLLAIAALLVSVAAFILTQVIVVNLPGSNAAPIDQSRYNPMVGNLPVLLLGVTLAWTTIAFGEEMFFRAFVINRLSDVFAATKIGQTLTLIASAVLFGFAHFMAEGWLGVLSNGLFGAVLAWFYLRSGRRNLWVTIIAHGMANSLRFILLFAGAG